MNGSEVEIARKLLTMLDTAAWPRHDLDLADVRTLCEAVINAGNKVVAATTWDLAATFERWYDREFLGRVTSTKHAADCELAYRAGAGAGFRSAVITTASADVLGERMRQAAIEGWTPAHDDRHTFQELRWAAGCYVMHAGAWYAQPGKPPSAWPWDPQSWKPKGTRRDLVRAAALLLAEIERLDRAAASAKGGD